MKNLLTYSKKNMIISCKFFLKERLKVQNCLLKKEIQNLFENLKKRQELDKELKENLNAFFNLVDEKAKTEEIKLSPSEWNTLGSLAFASIESTENLNEFTNFLQEKF